MKEFIPASLTERLSHEWRTPLQGILGAAELLHADKSIESEHLQTLLSCTSTLAARLDYFLVLLALEKNTFRVSPQWMPLPEVVQALTDRMESRLQVLPDITDLPHARVQIDTMRTLQLIDFLGGQADKDVTFAAKIYVDTSEKQQLYWYIQVKGQHTASPDRLGKRALKALCQRLSVRMTEQTGQSGFFLQQRLPLQITDTPAKSKQIETAHAAVLIVDDNATNRRVTAALLEELGLTTFATGKPEAVVKLLREQQVALVLMDIQMPQKDGRTLTEELRRAFGVSLPPIVAFTALNLPEEQNRWLQTGLMDDLLAKPARRTHLKQLLRRWSIKTAKMAVPSAAEPQHLPDFMDADVWKQLERYGGEELIRESLHEFEQETRQQLKQAWLAVQQQHWEELRKLMHTLKGSAGTLGIKKIAKTAASMEYNLREQAIYSDVFTDFTILQQDYHQFANWWLQFPQTNPTTDEHR